MLIVKLAKKPEIDVETPIYNTADIMRFLSAVWLLAYFFLQCTDLVKKSLTDSNQIHP